MGTTFFFTAMLAVLGLAFGTICAAIHWLERTRTAGVWFGAGFAAGFAGLVMAHLSIGFWDADGHNPAIIAALTFGGLFFGLFTMGLVRLHRKPVPKAFLTVCLAVVFVAVAFNVVLTPLEPLAMAVSISMLCVLQYVGFPAFPPAERRHRTDKLLLAVMTVIATVLGPGTCIALAAILYGAPHGAVVETGILVAATGIAMLAVATVISCLRDATEALRIEADHDAPTGLLNRRGLARLVIRERAAPKVGAHAVIVCDIDHFKRINDTMGHDVGDRIIQEVANILDDKTIENEVCARLGGEEFVIVIWDATTEIAHLRAQALRTAIESADHDLPEGLSVTASFGVSWWVPGDDFADAVRAADRALYRAKDGGRNRVEVTRKACGAEVAEPCDDQSKTKLSA